MKSRQYNTGRFPAPAICTRAVLTNLLTNARQVLEDRPQPRRVRLTARADGEWAQIEVADNGPGIADDVRSHVFEPFFTTKPVGAGTGVGLAVSRGIVEAHGGSLTLAPPDGGRVPVSSFACRWPAMRRIRPPRMTRSRRRVR